MLTYPRITIDLKKLKHNAKTVKELCAKQGIDVYPVMKGVGADRRILETLSDVGFKVIADSRIQNLIKGQDLPMEKMLLRLPMISTADEVVQHADISLNSELITIKALNTSAKKQNKKHKVVLMVELGDLREGILPKDIEAVAAEVLKLENIELCGVGVNLTCYGAVIPDENNIGELCAVATRLEEKFNIKLPIISGGNTSSIPMLLENTLPKKVNVLRLGEIILLGTESVAGTLVEGYNPDVFTIEAEIIELKDKNSLPTGKTGYDAFGKVYEAPEDKGIRRRAIVAIGRQDIDLDGIWPLDSKIGIIGSSSDHFILDMEDVKDNYKMGDTVKFGIKYSSLLRVMTSTYLPKNYIN